MASLPLLPLLLPLPTFAAAEPPETPRKADDWPAWALPETYSCTGCHAALPEDELGLRPHAPSLTRGWYRPAFVREYVERHGEGRTPAPFLPRETRQRDATLDGLESYAASIALAVDSIELDLTALEAGRQLYHSTGCVACHDPYEDSDTLPRPLWEFEELFSSESRPSPFPGLAEKFVAAGLAPYLESASGHDPLLRLEEGEADVIADFLMFEELGRAGAEIESGEGLMYEYYEGRFEDSDFEVEGSRLVERGVASIPEPLEHREDDFAYRYRGFIEVARAGFYTFHTHSDDGSWLWIDNELVVENGGMHAPTTKSGKVRLDPGKHAFEVRFFERSGGSELTVSWEGPGVQKGTIPPAVFSHKRLSVAERTAEVRDGTSTADERLLGALGCAACHDPDRAQPVAGPWRGLDPSGGGCLAAEPPEGLPRYGLDARERATFVALLEGAPGPAPEDHLGLLLESRGCVQCHARDGRGGPARERMAYFQVDSHAELGDEGRIPPQLDGVGAKLHVPWMEEVIHDGARSRPYMKTRMPAFPEEAKLLTSLFQELDSSQTDLVEPPFDVELVPIGRDLVGTGGLGCIQCHELAGYPSLGVPAVDLARVHERVKPAWFKQLLLDPIAINMNTRMPTFWTDGKSPVTDHFDGDPAQQIDAIWTYLSLASSMPLPEGLIAHESDYELDAAQRPTIVSVFGKDLSPRTLFVGYPERVHTAFDVDGSRLALAWRGRFFNARGTWHGRAGQLEEPWGEDVLEFPSGPPFALLEQATLPWPDATGREAGYRALGRRFDSERRPIFRYALGEIEFEERVMPRLSRKGGILRRELRVTAPRPVESLYFRAADDPGARVVVEGAQVSIVNEETRIPVSLVRDGELYRAEFSVEVNW